MGDDLRTMGDDLRTMGDDLRTIGEVDDLRTMGEVAVVPTSRVHQRCRLPSRTAIACIGISIGRKQFAHQPPPTELRREGEHRRRGMGHLCALGECEVARRE